MILSWSEGVVDILLMIEYALCGDMDHVRRKSEAFIEWMEK